MFRRSNSRESSLSAYMAGRFASVEEEDEESEEEPLSISQDYRRPQLDPISEGVNIKYYVMYSISTPLIVQSVSLFPCVCTLFSCPY